MAEICTYTRKGEPSPSSPVGRPRVPGSFSRKEPRNLISRVAWPRAQWYRDDVAFSVRRATERDVLEFPGVERSAGESFRSLPDLAWLADDDVTSVSAHSGYAKTGVVLAAVDETQSVVGLLSSERQENQLHIWIMGVRYDAQKRGVGRLLLEAVIESARDLGLTAMTLTTFRDVPWNAPFYERIGFRILDTGELDARLMAILRAETAHGLPGDRRCAMRYVL